LTFFNSSIYETKKVQFQRLGLEFTRQNRIIHSWHTSCRGGDLKAQSINLNLKKSYTLSQEYRHWFKDTGKVQFKLKNNSPFPFTGHCKFRVSKPENSDPLFGNNLSEDSIKIAPNSTKMFYFKDIITYHNLLIDESFYQYFNAYSTIPSGQFKFHLQIEDTTGIIKAADSFLFWIDSISSPVLYYPLNAVIVHQNSYNRIHFGYGNFKKEQYSGLRYIFKLWQRDSLENDFIFEDSAPAFSDTSFHAYHYQIPSGKFNLADNKYYYWQIECRNFDWNPLGANKGRSDIFFFETSNDSLYQNSGFYSDTSNDWAAEELLGTPTPPDPAYCEVFTGFETGSLKQNGWISYTGEITPRNRRNGQVFSPDFNGSNFFTAIWQSGYNNDLQAVAPPNDGRFGSRCAQLGNFVNTFNNNSVSIRKTWTVSNATKNIKIWYALVSEGPYHHSTTDEEYWKKNFFQVRIHKGSTVDKNNLLEEPIIDHSGPSDAEQDCWDQLGSGASARKRIKWICRTINLDAYLNSTITIDILTASCMPVLGSGGNHKTMAWVDFCVTEGTQSEISISKTRFCKNENISVSGTSSKYFKNHKWELWKTNANYIPQTLIFSKYGVCHTSPGNLNISNILESKGIKADCDEKYKIILLTNDDCCNWDTASKDINITCPEKLNIGPYCCTNWNCSILLGQTAKPGFLYKWTGAGNITSCLSATNIAQPYFNCGSFNPNCSVIAGPLVYWLHITDTNDCVDSQAVVINSLPVKAQIDIDSLKCEIRLCGSATTLGNETFTYNWKSMGATPAFHNTRCFTYEPIKKETWRLIITNSCGPDTVYATVDTLKAFKGPIDTLRMPAMLCDASEHDWVINYLNSKNQNSRYNINEFRLRMSTRWGGFTTIAHEESNTGFTQGHIRIPKEQIMKLASFGFNNFIFLEMRNCDPRNKLLHFSNDPYKVIFTVPNNCKVCVGEKKIKLMRAWYQSHEQGGQNTCYNLKNGGDFCKTSDWNHSSLCTKPNKNSKVQGAYLQRNCVCEHKVWSWMWEKRCDPSTYKEWGMYNIIRNQRNDIPVFFER
jgi:hypothetical protein